MDFSILLEPVNQVGFRAISFQPNLEAEGATREEALDQLRNKLQQRLAQAELVRLDVDLPGTNPLLQLAGTWRDHPDAAEYLESLREYRRQVDADPDRP